MSTWKIMKIFFDFFHKTGKNSFSAVIGGFYSILGNRLLDGVSGEPRFALILIFILTSSF